MGTAAQQAAAAYPLAFADTPLAFGNALSHPASTTDVTIAKPGIYLAIFHGSLMANAGIPLPASTTVQLELNNAPVPGAVSTHTFTTNNETATLALSALFQVTAAPATLRVVALNAGFTCNNIVLNVFHLRDEF